MTGSSPPTRPGASRAGPSNHRLYRPMTNDQTQDFDTTASDAELSDDQLEAAAGGSGSTEWGGSTGGVWAGEDGDKTCTPS